MIYSIKSIFKVNNTDIVCIFLYMAVAILSTKSVNAMEVEYPSLKQCWLSDSNVHFPIYNLFFLGFYKIGIK